MSFTPREREVAQSLAEGNTWDEVGASLGISVSTVRQHIDNMARKINAGPRKTRAIVKHYRALT